MKKTPLLNIALSRLIASLGHGDISVIADAGLPVLDALNEEGALGRRDLLSHEQFKVLSRQARAIVRTGECQPYCNIVLVAGVTF